MSNVKNNKVLPNAGKPGQPSANQKTGVNGKVVPDQAAPFKSNIKPSGSGSGSIKTTDELKHPAGQEWRKGQDDNILYQLDKYLKFEQVNECQIVEMGRWKEQDVKGNRKTLYVKEVQKRNDQILNVVEQSRLEKLQNFEDRWPCLNARKSLLKVRIYINKAALVITSSNYFENATITVILLNSGTLAVEAVGEEPSPEMAMIESIFLVLYTFEMCMKILAMGFIFDDDAYLRDFWGILDFTIVMSAYYAMMITPPKSTIYQIENGTEGGANLNALRAFRVLRPLRTITTIKGLKILVTSLLDSLPMMKQTIIVLIFFLLIFAIAGVQLLMGSLKQVCVHIDSGERIETEDGGLLCGGNEVCPDGYFCGKQNQNPNFEVTNLDNVWFALFMVFQCTTLEGWSDIQTLYQMTAFNIVFIFFISMVFIGAFFLMNLTLAVVNTSFTKSQNEAKAAAAPPKPESGEDGEVEVNLDEIEEDIGAKGEEREIGISEFFIAKRAAKKMIEFLRARQTLKAFMSEKAKLAAVEEANLVQDELETPNKAETNRPLYHTQSSTKKPTMGAQAEAQFLQQDADRTTAKKRANQSIDFGTRGEKVITEEEIEEEFNLKNHKDKVAQFLDDLNSDNGKPNIQKNVPIKQTAKPAIIEGMKQRLWEAGHDSLKPMKQLSRTSNNGGTARMTNNGKDRLQVPDKFSDTASKIQPDELDFDQLVNQSQKKIDKTAKQKRQSSPPPSSGDHPFDLSFIHSMQQDSHLFMSEDEPKRSNRSFDDLHSVIGSDEDFNEELNQLKQQKEDEDANAAAKKRQPPDVTPMRQEMIKNLKQRIRRYQTSNYDERKDINGMMANSQSTFVGLKKDRADANSVAQTQAEFDQGANKWTGGVQKPNAAAREEAERQGKIADAEPTDKKAIEAEKKRKLREAAAKAKNEIKMSGVDEQFLQMQRPKDPYEYIDKKTQKIAIAPGIVYKSTSQDEVFAPRINMMRAKALSKINKYIQKPVGSEEGDSEDFENSNYQMSKYDPYQMKCWYQIKENQEEVFSDDSDDDDMMDQPQPYETITNIGYKYHLTQLPTKFVARRSDIIVSSTLSFTLTPEDNNAQKKNLVEMTNSEREEWINNRHKFNATMINMHDWPDKDYVPEYYTHSLRTTFKNTQQPFQSSAAPMSVLSKGPGERKFAHQRPAADMGQDKDRKMLPGSLLREPLTPEQQQLLNDEERKTYKLQAAKFEGFKAQLKKMDVMPDQRVISLSDARRLRSGLFHEENDDDLLDGKDNMELIQQTNKTTYFGRDEDFNAPIRLEKFESAIKEILASKPNVVISKKDEVPRELRDELELPNPLGKHSIDYTEVRIKDCSIKKKTPVWSGQDVLEDSLREDKAEWAIEFINAVRVWPKGLFGIIKKIRCFLKIICKSALFDNSMLACVLLNTVVMAMESYGLTEDDKFYLEAANSVFTWIFIVEMSTKLLAIGVSKYCEEGMNLLDGGVVLLSIVELAMSGGGEPCCNDRWECYKYEEREPCLEGGETGGGSNLSAFRTIRIFRTFRVLRVARLLRALSSMKVIIAVIGRSFESFMYIAMLLFVMTFIFALLGKTLFGGQFNFAEGKPRGNFDGFQIAFGTVFQVLTMENWQTVAFDSMRSQVGMWLPAIFYIAWIFIGNFILLNLFLAILLDAFLDEDEAEELSEEQQEEKKIEREKRKEVKEQERLRKLKKLGMSMFKSGNIEQLARQKTTKKKAMNAMVNAFKKDPDIMVDDIEDLSSNDIRNYFLNEGILKDKTNKRQQEMMYSGVECQQAFYLLDKESKFRKFCYIQQTAKWFDNFIMVLIALNSVKLAADSYLAGQPDDSNIIFASKTIDIFFNVSFAIECLIKCLALGFTMDNGSYLRNGWNQLDFFIVMTSLIDMILGSMVDIAALRILRMLRMLRPLRVISHNVAMKLIVSALFESVGSIFNVVIVVMVVWLMFAILAINLLAGKSFQCSIGIYQYSTQYECNNAGGSWIVYDSNYDNVMQAMMTLFVVSTLEGWPDIMISSVDSVDVDKGPQMENSTAYVYFYILFIMIGSFFLLNFFIGVLFLKYTAAQKEESKGQTPAMIKWVNLQQLIVEAKVAHERQNMPDIAWRKKIWDIVNSTPFDILIMSFIVLNMIQMGFTYEGAPQSVLEFLRISNYVFTAVFLAEAILKLLAYDWSYFDTAWNKFDFFVVCASLFDLALEFMDAEAIKQMNIGNVAKVLRVLRVSRVLRLASKSKGLQALLQTITMSVSALANVLLLLLLILFMFAVLGVFMFAELSDGDVINSYKNFQNFGNSYLLLFAISTGEDWNRLMYDCVDTPPDCVPMETCGSSLAPIFYILFILIISHVMLNLFILVIIQQFEMFYVNDDNPIKVFSEHFAEFHNVWVEETVRFQCKKIKEKQLVEFFKKLPAPLGMYVPGGSDQQSEDEMKKQILKMGIRGDDGWIYFNELLYRCLRRIYGNFKLNQRMQIKELKTQFVLFQLTMKAKKEEKAAKSNETVFESLVNKGSSVNPFLTMMYYRISFMTWHNQMRKAKAKEEGLITGEEAKEAYVEVSIEVDVLLEVTSEEEKVDDEENASPPQKGIKRNRTMKSSTSKSKKLGSSSNGPSNVSTTNKKRRQSQFTPSNAGGSQIGDGLEN